MSGTSTMTIANYEDTTTKWLALPSTPTNLTISFGASLANPTCQANKTILTSTYGWNITDGGNTP